MILAFIDERRAERYAAEFGVLNPEGSEPEDYREHPQVVEAQGDSGSPSGLSPTPRSSMRYGIPAWMMVMMPEGLCGRRKTLVPIRRSLLVACRGGGICAGDLLDRDFPSQAEMFPRTLTGFSGRTARYSVRIGAEGDRVVSIADLACLLHDELSVLRKFRVVDPGVQVRDTDCTDRKLVVSEDRGGN